MTFRYKPEESFADFTKKKARRLLVPYFGYNLFLFLFFFVKNDLLAGQVSAQSFFPLLGILYSRNCLFPADAPGNVYFMQILNAPTWFLTCMFLAYLIFWLLMRAAKGNMKKALYLNFGLLLASVLLHYLCTVLLPWSLDCALYSLSLIHILHILLSFNSYMAYLGQLRFNEPSIYYGVWAFVELGLLVLVGLDIWKYMKNPENQLAPVKKEAA